jgi:hypothetical protein
VLQTLEVDGGQGLGRGLGLEVNGRQEVEVELDGVQEVNRRRRGVSDEYAIGGIRLQSRRNTCRHQVYCLQMGHMRCM